MLENRKPNHKNQISERNFGVTFGILFLLLALGAWHYQWFSFLIPVALSVIFIVAAIWIPSILYYPNKVWFIFGKILQKMTTPVILGIMFFLVLFPLGFVRKLFGKSPLNKDFKKMSGGTYWLERDKGDTKFEHIF